MKERILLIFAGIFLVFFVLVFRPITASDESECNVTSGILVNLHEGGENDIVFRLKDNEKIYYINRGLEHGFTLEELGEKLLENEVTIWSARHWTPLDPKGKTNHICKVTYQDEVLFTEFD